MIIKTHPIAEKLLKKGLNLNLNLLDLLNKEADSLKQKTNPTMLSSLANSKKETVSQLNQFSKQFSQVLLTEKLQMTPEGVFDYFEKAKTAQLDTGKSTHYWKEILSIAKQCRSLNENNGASINLLMQYSQRSLHILQGKSQQPNTYGSDGSAQRELFSHTLFSV
jgi:flagella synthesis protein FlgN